MKHVYLSFTFLCMALMVALPVQATTPAPADTTLLDGLLAYWSLDEASGTRYDSHTRDVDLVETDTVTSIVGVVDSAALFDETNGHDGAYLSVPTADRDTLDMGLGDYSVAFWVRIDSLTSSGGYSGILHTGGSGATNPGFEIYTRDNNRLVGSFADGNNRVLITGTRPGLDTWFFVVLNIDRDGDMALYVDGSEIAAASASALSDSSITTNQFVLSYRTTERLHGAMDEVGVWSRTLTQSEINWLYNSGNGRAYADFCTSSSCNTGSGSQARGGDLAFDPPNTDDELPQSLSLGHYPNPFNPQATITYDLPNDAPVRLEVFDLLGRRVALLVDAPVRAGTHQVRFDGSRLASGLYLYRMQALGQVRTGRMLLVK